MDDSARNVLLFTDGEEGSLSFIALDKKVKATLTQAVKQRRTSEAADAWRLMPADEPSSKGAPTSSPKSGRIAPARAQC